VLEFHPGTIPVIPATQEDPLSRILLEIIACTVEDCVAAESGGADRIELCAAISTGGLTPSLGTLVEAKKRVKIPVMAMVRPRAGGFCYSDEDFAVMRRDAALMVEHGADGIVFGIVHADGSVGTKRCGKIVEIAGDRQTVFHRAFDVVAEPLRALDELVDLGFTRVLTSGQNKTAYEGRLLIERLIRRAAGRIEVLPGGGVRAHNVLELVEETGCTQVHMTAFSGQTPTLNSSCEQVDWEIVQRVRDILSDAERGG
jgi:copper homeostasis protein